LCSLIAALTKNVSDLRLVELHIMDYASGLGWQAK